MSLINAFIERCSQKRVRIGVVGDAMVDQYYSVSVNRISPEFPIPVIKASTEQPTHSLPGGAANVCYQMRDLNVQPSLIGFLDPVSEHVFHHHFLDTWACVMPRGASVPLKKRYYDGNQPFCRIDIEKDLYGLNSLDLANAQNNLFELYEKEQPNEDVLILSDYNKGVFQGLECRRRWISLGIPTVVDPKTYPAGWEKCTVFKPNAEEAARLSNRTSPEHQAAFFRDSLKCKHVVITRSGAGVSGWDGDSGEFFEYHNPAQVKATSVIGAGDCFAAFLATAMSLGFSIRECAEIAFKAGTVYVRSLHNHPVSPYELLASEDPVAAKFMKPVRRDGETLVFTNGCFDILHQGHLDLLRFAKGKGDKLVVALNSDASIRRLKGESRPILPLAERMAMVAALEVVDFVTSFEEDVPYECVKSIRPDVLVKGADYTIDQISGADLVKEVHRFPILPGCSTTNIVQRIKESQ